MYVSILESKHLRIILTEHWNENVIILMKFSSPAASQIVKMTTFSAASDENFVKMMTFPFQWMGDARGRLVYPHLSLFVRHDIHMPRHKSHVYY